jgi:hypothetical protein
MSRARITESVLQPRPDYLMAVDGASVTVRLRNAGLATVYRDETGAATLTNPVITRNGRIEPPDEPGGDCWLETGSYDLVVSYDTTSYQTAFEAVSGNQVKAGATSDATYDAKGDLVVGTGPDVAARLPVGANGQVLTADSAQASGTKWATPTIGAGVAADPIWDAKGDLAAATGPDTAAKLAAGVNGQVLTADSSQATGVKWATPAASSGVATDPIFDAKGDLAVAFAPDQSARLAVGTDGQVLQADSAQLTGVKWTTLPSGGMVADPLWDAKGDLAVATGSDAAAKLAVGANGQVLTADSAQATGIKWAAAGGGGGGGELAYAQITSLVTVSGTSEGAPTDVISSGAITYAATKIKIEFYAPATFQTGTLANLTFNLWDDTTNLGQLGFISFPSSGEFDTFVNLARILTPTAGSHTYRIRAHKGGGACGIAAGAGGVGAFVPAFIRVSSAT